MFDFTAQNQEFGAKVGGILEVVGGFDVMSGSKWVFPDYIPKSLGNDGCVGKTTVSQYVNVPVASVAGEIPRDLAVHITFNIKEAFVSSAPKRPNADWLVRLALTNLHYTARPENVQISISSDGYSIVAAGASIHRGAFSQWNHNESKDKLEQIAEGLGLSRDIGGGYATAQTNINQALATFDANSVLAVGQLIIDTLHTRVVNRIKNTDAYKASSKTSAARCTIVGTNFITKGKETYDKAQ